MSLLDSFFWSIAAWTTLEGSLFLSIPRIVVNFGSRIIPRFTKILSEYSDAELRKLGAIELVFGLTLGFFLNWVNSAA